MATLAQTVAAIRDRSVRASVEASIKGKSQRFGAGYPEQLFASDPQYRRYFGGRCWLTDAQMLETLRDQLGEMLHDDRHPDATPRLSGNRVSMKLRDGRTITATVTIA